MYRIVQNNLREDHAQYVRKVATHAFFEKSYFKLKKIRWPKLTPRRKSSIFVVIFLANFLSHARLFVVNRICPRSFATALPKHVIRSFSNRCHRFISRPWKVARISVFWKGSAKEVRDELNGVRILAMYLQY